MPINDIKTATSDLDDKLHEIKINSTSKQENTATLWLFNCKKEEILSAPDYTDVFWKANLENPLTGAKTMEVYLPSAGFTVHPDDLFYPSLKSVWAKINTSSAQERDIDSDPLKAIENKPHFVPFIRNLKSGITLDDITQIDGNCRIKIHLDNTNNESLVPAFETIPVQGIIDFLPSISMTTATNQECTLPHFHRPNDVSFVVSNHPCVHYDLNPGDVVALWLTNLSYRTADASNMDPGTNFVTFQFTY